MLDIFKARLKAKLKDFKAQNLSQKRIDAIADRLHKKFPDLTEEADHDARIDEVNEITPFSDIAKDDDRIRTLEAKKPADTTDEDVDEEKPAKKPVKKDDEMPAWFKPYADKVNRIERKEQSQSMTERIKSHEKMKDVPAAIWRNRPLPEKDEDIDAFVDTALADWDEVKPAGIVTTRPAGGSAGATKGPKPSEAEIKELQQKFK